MQDPLICMLRLEVENGTRTYYSVRNDGALMVGTRLYVPGDEALKRKILEEAHCSAFAKHPGSTKMYRALTEHEEGNSQICYGEHITMHFVFKLPQTQDNHDGV
ncbi:hypothetical protein L3X38_003998 [Prunus dulcis]|uniref:Uncharacterized protein n=1 Tax=Prunus dulcis TaxID=3755 RepID=A0AAD5F2Q0_PRUDU|nr:hypothetical protein L3X38_003998 [Prunus dulcis]